MERRNRRIRVPCNGNARGEQATFVRLVFVSDPFWDGDEALETGRRCHMAALRAAMERRGALRAGLQKVEARRQWD